jgi:anti-sigma B factor antagonist
MNSPLMKAFGDERIAAGERCLTVDLGGCTGMDSTFMGTLAGMATRLSCGDGAGLQIADAGSRNKRSLEDLGLDFLMEIDPPDAVWRRDIEQIRARLVPPQSLAAPGQIQRALHVLEAHQILSETNEQNAKTFSNVVTMLETELNEKHKLAVTPEKR